ncbi:NADP-dependent oxidoreductase [Streptomyces sp. NPDC003388]|uniref:NADP-dependent oxidoreductase n=1 Tax=unclassified Streptomyces TaxID=2593676 RepID=UPI001170D457|nr:MULTISPECIES: NADP-dependent oxidoreductase [unclassified Streptomyces]MDI1457886.1 NADP-dependent oxidoreductase [Streptomyces sp. ATE26]GEK04381.1 oxidoreductase [Streptomyces sp. 1-11]
MKAITLQEYGSADDLKLVEAPDPKVAPGEVLIRVKAAGVNPVDWKLAAGHLDPIMEVRFPLIPGWDVSGVVERVGLDAKEFSVGDEVFGYVRKDWAQNGAYAELVSAPVRALAKKPAALTWEQAAGVPLAGLTAYQSIRRVGLVEGETVLIHAAAGGVGSFGVQIALALGARVIGTASEDNHGFLRELGAEPVAYGEGIVDRVRRLVPDGVDAALDFVGHGAVDVSQRLLKRRDRVASITESEVEAKGGHHVWVRPNAADLADLAGLADAGRLVVPVQHVLPLADAARAWHLSQSGHTRGKIVLTL